MSELAIPHQEAEQEVMPSFHFLLEDEAERTALVAEHRNWLRSIRRERPLPKTTIRWLCIFAISTRRSMKIISLPIKRDF